MPTNVIVPAFERYCYPASAESELLDGNDCFLGIDDIEIQNGIDFTETLSHEIRS